MRTRDRTASRWRGYWAELRHDYRQMIPGMRESWHQAQEEWRETQAAIREARHWDWRLRQKITGLQAPTRKDVRQAVRAQRRQERQEGKQ